MPHEALLPPAFGTAAEAPAVPPPVGAAPKRVQTRPFATGRTIIALILREMSTRYGRSPGGYLWALLEPLGAVALMALAFSLLMRHPALGTSFLLFYATGHLPFTLYQSVMNVVARSLNYSRPLLMYPAVTWLDAVIARFLLNTLTGMMVSYILLTAIISLTDTGAVLQIGPILMAALMAAALGLGVGCLNCVLNGLFPTWEMIWSIATRPLFLASGVLILYEDMPRVLQDILWYNPLLHVTGEMRRGFYPMYSADYVSPVYVFLIALTCIAAGLVFLSRYHRTILNDG